MKVIKPYVEVPQIDGLQLLKNVEKAARVCYKSEDKIGPATYRPLIDRILKTGHESVLEHEKVTVKFVVDRGVSHELVRHRIASFSQESTRYCVAGNTKLCFKNPHNKMTIEELYANKCNSPNGAWKRMMVKQLNEDTGELVYSTVEDVFCSGEKQVFLIKTKLGYKIETTADHLVKTDSGYERCENLLGKRIAVNGTSQLYRNKEWLQHQYNTLGKTAPEIASEYGFNGSTIKSWVRKHDLPTKPRSYWNIGREPWNKGLTEKDDPRVQKQGDALREHHWNSGRTKASPPRKERIRLLSPNTYHKTAEEMCLLCGSTDNLNVHHIDGDRGNNELSNLATCCVACHQQLHNKSLKVVVYDEVVSITPGSTVPVYDFSVRGPYHNFIGNGVVVHNCNYSNGRFGGEITVIEPWFFRPSDTAGYKTWFQACRTAERGYLELLEGGATPQEARSVLPNSLKTEIVVTFNLREWRHFFKLRCDKAAHPQMQQVAIPLLRWFAHIVPQLVGDIEHNRDFPRWCYAEVREVEEGQE